MLFFLQLLQSRRCNNIFGSTFLHKQCGRFTIINGFGASSIQLISVYVSIALVRYQDRPRIIATSLDITLYQLTKSFALLYYLLDTTVSTHDTEREKTKHDGKDPNACAESDEHDSSL